MLRDQNMLSICPSPATTWLRNAASILVLNCKAVKAGRCLASSCITSHHDAILDGSPFLWCSCVVSYRLSLRRCWRLGSHPRGLARLRKSKNVYSVLIRKSSVAIPSGRPNKGSTPLRNKGARQPRGLREVFRIGSDRPGVEDVLNLSISLALSYSVRTYSRGVWHFQKDKKMKR